MNKKWAFLTLFFFMFVVIIMNNEQKKFKQALHQKPKASQLKKSSIKKHSHVSATRSLAQVSSTDDSKKPLGRNSNSAQKAKTNNDHTKKPIGRDERKILGAHILSKEHKENPHQWIYENYPSSHWKIDLEKNLMRFRKKAKKTIVTPLRSFLQITKVDKNNQVNLRYVEEVMVETIFKNKRSSFNALVDSSSGKILEQFNQTRHENFFSYQRNKFKLSPLTP